MPPGNAEFGQISGELNIQRHPSYKTWLHLSVGGTIVGVLEIVNHVMTNNPHPIHSILLAGWAVTALIWQGYLTYSAGKEKII